MVVRENVLYKVNGKLCKLFHTVQKSAVLDASKNILSVIHPVRTRCE